MEDVIDEEELLQKHKKEKKELTARIQQLKKSVPPNDKKRKKEILVEIAEWESNLDAKHEAELLNLKEINLAQRGTDDVAAKGEDGSDNNPDLSADGCADEGAQQEVKETVSKAQKRREKKERQDKERTQRIREAESSGVKSEKVREMEKVKEQLAQRGLNVHEVAADGNCLYSAVSHQLQLQGQTMTVAALRQLTASQLRNGKDDYQPFACHPDSGDMLDDDQYEKYCHRVETTSDWGGHLEITALSKALQKPIEVIQAGVVPVVTGSEYQSENSSPLLLAYHRHAYRLGEHYNSTKPLHRPNAASQQQDDGPDHNTA